MTTTKITYTAFANTPDGKIGLIFVTRENGRQVSQEWTGEYFPDTTKGRKACLAEVSKRNGCA